MKYQNLDLKMDQFVAYVNSDKINLIPSFQRGHVWKLPTRRKLIANIVQGDQSQQSSYTGRRLETNIPTIF